MDKISKIIIKQLAEGKTQPEIKQYLINNKLEPNSLSTIEKRIKTIKAEYKCSTSFQLAVVLTKKGIIK